MRLLRSGLLILGSLALVSWSVAAMPSGETPSRTQPTGKSPAIARDSDHKENQRPTPRFPIGKETTYVTGPLDRDGYIDYTAALNRILSRGVTPENNANVLLWKAFGPRPGGAEMPPEYFRWLGIKAPPEKGDYLIGLDRYAREHLKLKSWEQIEGILKQQDRAGQRPWTAKEYPEIVRWLKVNEKPLTVAVEATRRLRYFNPLVPRRSKKGSAGLLGTLLPSIWACREIAAALAARALLGVREGRVDEAWQDLLACHRLARLVGRGATLVEGNVGRSLEQLANDADLAFIERARLSSKRIKACLHDLQTLPPLSAMADKVGLADRFMFLDTVVMVDRQGLQYLENPAGFPLWGSDARNKKPRPNIDWEPALRDGNRWYNRLAATMRIKDRAFREKLFDQMDRDLKGLKNQATNQLKIGFDLARGKDPGKTVGKAIGEVLISTLMPAARRLQHAEDRAEQIQRDLHITFALAAYRRDHDGYPATLRALAPAYLQTVPGDLFSGKELVYRLQGKGYLLYSVGVNGRDDGGRGSDDEPSGDDLRIRIPLPKLGMID
jgi:hypothetical protein